MIGGRSMQQIAKILPNPVAQKTVRYMVTELQERNDYEAAYKMYQCSSCSKEIIQGITYRFHGQNDWIDVPPPESCPECLRKFTGREVTEDRLESRRDIIIDHYWCIPDSLKEAGFKNYETTIDGVVNNVAVNALNKCRSYVAAFKRLRNECHNLVLVGGVGTGKSHLCTSIARTLRHRGDLVGFITMSELLSKIKATYNKHSAKTESDILAEIKKFQCLIIDDLAAENVSEWSVGMVFNIINARYGRPTVYSTNFKPEDLEKIYAEFDPVGRIVSRLHYNTEFVGLYTDDYRKRKVIS